MAGGGGGTLSEGAGCSLRQSAADKKIIMSNDLISRSNRADQGEAVSLRGAPMDGLLLLLLWCACASKFGRQELSNVQLQVTWTEGPGRGVTFQQNVSFYL